VERGRSSATLTKWSNVEGNRPSGWWNEARHRRRRMVIGRSHEAEPHRGKPAFGSDERDEAPWKEDGHRPDERGIDCTGACRRSITVRPGGRSRWRRHRRAGLVCRRALRPRWHGGNVVLAGSGRGTCPLRRVRKPFRIVSWRFEGGSGPHVRQRVYAVRPSSIKASRALRSSVQ
jgi:hypothetical protein